MKSRIINFKDLKVEFSNRYNVIEQDGTIVIKTIEYNPGIIYENGTPETAENFNTIQSNCVYEVDGIRILEGQEEIYDISIDGFDNFIFENLKIILKPDSTNVKKGSFVRLNNEKYLIKNHLDSVGIGQIFKDENIPLTLNFSKKTADIIGVVSGGATVTLKEAIDIFYNHCPYRIGDMLTTTLMENPALTWIGTTWQKIEGKYLKGSKGAETSKTTGGSNTKTLTVDQMPSHGHSSSGSTGASGKHTHTANHGHSGTASAHTHTANHNHTASQSAHAHSQPAHQHESGTPAEHQGPFGSVGDTRYRRNAGADPSVRRNYTSSNGGENTGSATPAVTVNTANVTTSSATPTVTVSNTNVTTSEIADHSHTVSVSIGATGGGQAIDIQPEYYIVHHWLRTA